MSEQKRNLRMLWSSLAGRLAKFKVYLLPAFLVFVGLVYAFLFLRINTLVSVQPSDAEVSSQIKSSHTPRIDENLVEQLKSLQDNSVSVKALFEEARNNPFQ